MANRPAEPPAEPAISVGLEDPAPPQAPFGGRFDLGDKGLRERAARGAVVNSIFQVGLVGLSLIRNVAVAAFLTASEFGLWGLVITTLMTLIWLRQVGIGDKYVQQEEADQELAFQKAFTLELAYSVCFYALVLVLLPMYALIYDRPDILLPSLILSLTFLTTALQTPIWIAWRQMRFVRQRVLEAVEPVVSTVLVISLAIAGAGYWSLVIGLLVGSIAGAICALVSCPYPIRLRYDGGTMREYVGFSWPLLAASGSALIVVQGTVIIGNYTVGLAGLGAIGLAGQIAKFADQVDGIISRTIYPAICAVKDRLDVLQETFVKSNRLAVMWGLPFGVGLALFAPSLVAEVLGPTWEPAVPLLQAFGLILGFRQVGFNWMLFYSARGETRPVAVEGVMILVVFAVVTAPLLIAFGLDGYVIGSAVTVVVQLLVRAVYLSRLFDGLRFVLHLARSMAPAACGTAAVGVVRALAGGDSLEWALAELAIYVVAVVAATVLIERSLLSELAGYLRGGSAPAPPGDSAPRTVAA